MHWVAGGVTAAKGFLAGGVHSGIKRSRKPDLAVVVARDSAMAAGVLTTNKVKAAPVQISARRLKRGVARGVLLNSGCANCLTGSAGLRDALSLGRYAARALKVAERDLLPASTGLIGTRLPVSKIKRAIPRLTGCVSRANHAVAAQAIMTTDRVPKEAAVEARIGGRLVRVGGMAKGSGMIAPSMATMLCVLTTDARIAPSLLRAALRKTVERTFNRISVDGDMSTNDTVFALASGCSGSAIRRGAGEERVFARMLEAVCVKLAEDIVADGEGASRVMEVRVVGARTDKEASSCARQVACSPLVKTMLAGGDPNVGRIAGAVGASSASFNAHRLKVRIGPRLVISGGRALSVQSSRLRSILSKKRLRVLIDLNAGCGEYRMLTCDLSAEYVRINSGYAT